MLHALRLNRHTDFSVVPAFTLIFLGVNLINNNFSIALYDTLKTHISVSFVANYVLSLFIFYFFFEVLRQQEVEFSKVESFMETISKSSFNLYCMVIFMSEAGQAA